MDRGREWIVLFLCFLAETGMVFQFVRPNYFFCASMIIAGTSYMVARVIILINILGIAVFAMSVLRGNVEGWLHKSYFIMMVYAITMIVMAIVPRQYMSALNNERLEMNSLVYLITMILAVIVFMVFILREKSRIRAIPKFSSVMLLVIIGEFVTNGIFIESGRMISGAAYLVLGLISAMPYIAVFVFESFVLEPTMMRRR